MVQNEYTKRINTVCDYIEKDLSKSFTLDELAEVANFSKFHFTRIFQGITGETPFQFLNRLRLERAASLLKHHPNHTISDISTLCGFTSLSIFSRNFKNYFNISATAYRKQKSNLSKIDRNNDQLPTSTTLYLSHDLKNIKYKTNMEILKNVEVKELPEMTVAYVRHVGPYKGDAKLFESLHSKLLSWAEPNGILEHPDVKSLIIYHDDIRVTESSKLRVSVSMTIPKETKVEAPIGKMTIEKTKYVVACFAIKVDQFQEAWDWLMGSWFPNSGYQPDDKPFFELYPETPKNETFLVEICIPVKPL
ncbi:AraC family transcriptional regulator [Aquimarina algicola]|uniref:AraC family transcriptional regulator n=1 Tax=Aquimarina algicola TaxID=2589995 RepID=A0A504J9W6_9FLAO|nr:AraC family transcriptional regulator [Aquimarina algicola]TPN83460.1 AraC family transcriptional regulator [Aquimarina algicola]